MSRYSNIIENKRNQLKGAFDEFCTFEWRGKDLWEEYGVFIISDKRGDLKAHSGPSFTNNYAKPQFESAAAQIQGVTFSTKSISFKIGIYWTSMEEYRELLNWLHPYEIGDLSFSYNNNYAYFCKLSKIDDASKYIVGYEGDEIKYYFETNIAFEIQGESCAHSKYSFPWLTSSQNMPFVEDFTVFGELNATDGEKYQVRVSSTIITKEEDITWSCGSIEGSRNSELDTHFKINFNGPRLGKFTRSQNVKLYKLGTEELKEEMKIINFNEFLISGELSSIKGEIYYDSQLMGNLFEVYFKEDINITPDDDLKFTYDSRHGLLFWGAEDQLIPINYFLLWKNQKCITSIELSKITIPGRLNKNNIDYSKIKLKITYNIKNPNKEKTTGFQIQRSKEKLSTVSDSAIWNFIKTSIELTADDYNYTNYTSVEDGFFSPQSCDILMYSKQNMI